MLRRGRPRDRRELSFFEHLDELRARLIRCIVYVLAGSAAGWVYREPILDLLRRPAEVGARAVGIEHLPFRVFEPAGGFVIAIQVALVTGIVVASPLVLWEVWRFVEPALEDNERAYAVIVVPMAILLFLGGVVFCYLVSPRAFAFLFQIDRSLGVEVERTLRPYLWFIMRLMLGFGVAFELPLVLTFLGFIGVVNSRQLLGWWRHAAVAIFAFSALVTPTVDPVNMTILAAPLFGLYLLSIIFVRLVQRERAKAVGDEWEGPEPETEGDGAEPEAAEDTLRPYREVQGDAQVTDVELPPPQDDESERD